MESGKYSKLRQESGQAGVYFRQEKKLRRTSFILTLTTIFLTASLATGWIFFRLGYFDNVFYCSGAKNSTSSPVKASKVTAQCINIPTAERHDCWPQGDGASLGSCQAKGCCWQVANDRNSSKLGDVPSCFYPKDYSLYTVKSLQKSDTGIFATLTMTHASGWPNDINTVELRVMYDSQNRLHFKFYDPNNQRYEVPVPMNTVEEPVSAAQTDYVVDIPSQGPFYMTVTRRSTGQVMFSTKGKAPLIFSDQFLQIGTQLSSPYIYGLGEHRAKFLLDTQWNKLVLWSRDQPPSPNKNLYGVHPFYMNIETDTYNNVHGVFLLNSNAMGIQLQPSPSLTFMTTGGILDFYIFTGPTPDNVVQQYTGLIGRPFLPPYWSLGFHLCRWGYGGVDGMKKVIQRNRDAKIPFDTVWNDIGYMKKFLDWTFDNSTGRYNGLPDVVADIHNNGEHYIMIIDPGISNTQPTGTYPPYDDGIKQDIFIKTPNGSGPIIGTVWPGTTAYPDFFHPNIQNYWTTLAKNYHNQIAYDGIWIDMNEPSNFNDNSITGCPNNTYENPPYVPVGIVGGTLRSRSICASSRQFNGLHYNLHSLYGYSEAFITKNALDSVRGNKRGMVLTRSTFPGSGRHAAHWLGDNNSKWDDLYRSIAGVMNFQMFGIPFVGADICGFVGDTNPELCARWIQLGAFYPFMRTHNMIGWKDQDPASFDTATQKIMRDAINLRYSLLPYLYTLMYHSHVDGSPIVRPLWFQYTSATATYANDVQFMWGSGLLITPTISPNTVQGEGFLPQDMWYDWYNHSSIISSGRNFTFDLPMEHANVQIRAGSIIPMQAPNVTTTAARKGKFSLLVALRDDTSASGELYWDDGESQDSISAQNHNVIQFHSSKDVLSNQVIRSGYTGEPMALDSVAILGVLFHPSSVKLNGHTLPTSAYQYQNKALYIQNQSINLLQQFSFNWLE